MGDLRHLRMRVGPAAWFNYRLRRLIAWTLAYLPGAGLALRALKSLTTHLSNIDTARRQTLEFARKTSDAAAHQFGSGFGYSSPFAELQSVDYYRQQLVLGQEDEKTESGAVYRKCVELASRAIEEGGPRKVLNFGVCYAYVDDLLAQKWPQVSFVGIDRAEITKFYNAQYFNRPNLEIVAGDIFDCLRQRSWDKSLFMHVRTLTCLPQTFVESLYESARTAGMAYILGIEQCGISWETGRPYDFDTTEKKSVVFRNYMYIHNYPGVLLRNGYELVHSELLKTPHPDPNYRLIAFLAKRKE